MLFASSFSFCALLQKSWSQFAYVSVLSSDDFLLAARVMAHTLQKHHNSSIPYLLLYTEDVGEDSLRVLRNQEVLLRRVDKIDTPLLETHPAKKFQYTKIQLWSLVEYEALVYLDLDTIVLDSVDELFDCGPFCASLRHSDMFNSGVFVLRPNRTVYEEMLNSTAELTSYGLLQHLLWQVKWAKMFDPNAPDRTAIQRLSAAYNYDVGVYYLSGKMLVQPKIVHYTLAFRRWHWYGYPIFDLNEYWHDSSAGDARSAARSYRSNGRSALFGSPSSFCSSSANKSSLRSSSTSRSWRSGRPTLPFERSFVLFAIMSAGVVGGVWLTPLQMLPLVGWTFFCLHFSVIVSILGATYSRLRFGYGSTGGNLLAVGLLTLFVQLVSWNVLARIERPPTRFLVAILFMLAFATATTQLLGVLLFAPQLLNRLRYGERKAKESTENLNLLFDCEHPNGSDHNSCDV
ncbi:hypothetical protein M3Y99_00062200 [Aphelenchoides fujianensis]|nr:hypothetical protein M3Y99_00062200 [Aphelenchoides fujianensis]